ncbi:FAD linked oxidase-like protein [Amycolatopsis mediterranei S699]|uniref:FAD linked oxidase-like protein n=2 Tax=Amycolatopsis mediterranei TaxID=33910 RepID=A0A0H3D0Q1_AMYMU|nr:FAD-binding oxidoreductase [Amycolatopsis mediterranei]ADJ44205.1 FAD linked oxidase-like protein [Amycolatopsis mediterranei U32]AEK40941.1 FAD linked oxidase-like protein [Amycolatopsis mediterranei S699]AFO75918.1 FAD linked oxidase-like protein [Amycolatopsis mediterranei S699]AGT83047.1 FAD linked oxidase-like protein [Amycolatopsis mediterranei RB]KDO06878.1 FAD-linked oxidase [Amycolatopsis mediterranei]
MTSTAEPTLESLRTQLSGAVLTDGDPGYDVARSVWNGEIDRRPAVVVRPAGPADVAAALAYAREAGLDVSVRGGGHNYGGAAVVDGGLCLDLSSLGAIDVDPDGRTVRCGGGTTWAQLDAATQEHALAVPGGTISHTGVGGLTLGGGFGWLTGKYGLSCDNLVSVELVTADGEILRVSAGQHSDLFWALRGGGGNFGVVTEFEFRLHPVGPIVHLGLFFYGLDDGVAALRHARELLRTLPGELGVLVAGLNAPPAPFVPEPFRFRPGYAVLIAGFDGEEQHAEAARAARSGPAPLFEFVSPIPYVELQRMLDDAAPWGILAYEKAAYADGFTDEVIEVIADFLPRKTSPMSIMPIFSMRGAFTEVADDATAFGGPRRESILINIDSLAAEPEPYAADRAWVREFWAALVPVSSNSAGYVNFMAEYEADRVRTSYGPEKYERLARIKAAYDPRNVFHHNANIPPAR